MVILGTAVLLTLLRIALVLGTARLRADLAEADAAAEAAAGPQLAKGQRGRRRTFTRVQLN